MSDPGNDDRETSENGHRETGEDDRRETGDDGHREASDHREGNRRGGDDREGNDSRESRTSDPFRPVAATVDRFEGVAGAVVEDPGELLDDLAAAVLGMSREERFVRSVDVLERLVEAELGPEGLPGSTITGGTALMEMFETDLVTAAEAVAAPDTGADSLERPLVLAALNAVLLAADTAGSGDLDDAGRRRAASTALAVYCRLYRACEGRAVDPVPLATDAVLAYRSLGSATGREGSLPEPGGDEEAIRLARRIGAVEWYRRGDHSTAEAAAMAGVPEGAFEKLAESLDG